jgi:hypothetical protein
MCQDPCDDVKAYISTHFEKYRTVPYGAEILTNISRVFRSGDLKLSNGEWGYRLKNGEGFFV